MKALFLFVFCCIQVLAAQQTQFVDFKTCAAALRFDVSQRQVTGTVAYRFKVLKAVDSIYLDARSMAISKLQLDTKTVAFKNTGRHLVVSQNFKAGQHYNLVFHYTAQPKKALYFIDWDYPNGNQQIWTQGQGKYTSHWLPSIDDENEKIEFDLSITFDSDFEVVSNGKLLKKQKTETTTTWYYDMQHPMSSYLVALGIGKYAKKIRFSKKGTPLEFYYYPEDSLKFEPTYRYTKEVFDFLEEEIGMNYPWQNYKMLPVKDFLYAGMENTSLNIYSDTFVVDAVGFNDMNFVNINAHELAHQWFGDLVTATSGTHHWLQEGFATYYALLAEQHLFGASYYNWALYGYAQELLAQDKAGASTSILNPKSSSTTFYKKGAWILYMLRAKVGDKAFKKGVKAYLKQYKFKNVETRHFMAAIETASGRDLTAFYNTWIKSQALDYTAMEEHLFLNEKSIFVHADTAAIGAYPIQCEGHIEACKTLLLETKSDALKAHIIKQLKGHISKTTFLNTGLKARQAIATTLTEIPRALKADYETLLNDASYRTIEAALFTLWRHFPEDRSIYLERTKHLEGFATKNIRTMWLALALLTEGYHDAKKERYLEELTDYTSPKYGFEVRQNAFQFLNEIQACHSKCKAQLKEATKHHNWRFQKFAKLLLRNME